MLLDFVKLTNFEASLLLLSINYLKSTCIDHFQVLFSPFTYVSIIYGPNSVSRNVFFAQDVVHVIPLKLPVSTMFITITKYMLVEMQIFIEYILKKSVMHVAS